MWVGAWGMLGMVACAAIAWAALTSLPNWRGDGLEKLGRPAVAADVVGTWQFQTNAPRRTVTFTFNADGTYRQEVTFPAGAATSRAPQTRDGRWELSDKDSLIIHGLLVETVDDVQGPWKETELNWFHVRQSKLRPGAAAISGGESPDPDVFREMTKLK